MKSIIHSERSCFICGKNNWLENHHIFGAADKKKSTKYGLTVLLCHFCHNEPPDGVHHNAKNMKKLKRIGQRAYMKHYNKTVDEFRDVFGESYL